MRRLGSVGVAILATVALTGIAGVPSAGAAPIAFSSTPVAGWSTNGIVKTVLVVGDTVYAGGDFTQVRSPGGQTLARIQGFFSRCCRNDQVGARTVNHFAAFVTENASELLVYSNHAVMKVDENDSLR